MIVKKILLFGDESKFELDRRKASELIGNKTVMVTGGGGSIGSELCRQIASFKPSKLILVDIYENNAYDVINELSFDYPHLNLVPVIASIRDMQRMRDIFYRFQPEIVFHAAAHKHVPLMESNPSEAIKNNVFGTLNLALCANEYKTEKFILISTDKAVNPTNVMGASKRVCEMLVNAVGHNSATVFASVRFGNVLGSSGSVVPLFKKQIEKGGPITITHKDATRYFMTIPEASLLVLQAAIFARGGEIFVLDMGEPVKIYDIAQELIKKSGHVPGEDIKIKEIGLRRGEKLHEELIMQDENLVKTENAKIYVTKSPDITIKELESDLLRLKKAASSGDDELVKEILSEIVPTYSRTK